MILIYSADNNFKMADKVFFKNLGELPKSWQSNILRYKRWQDRQSSLFGKLLLFRGLIENGYRVNSEFLLEYSKNKRPFLKDFDGDFNISHTEGLVLCAISKDQVLGLDVEKIREIEFDHYTETMTLRQWDEINKSYDKFKTFFTFWTIKECVLKANGIGITLPLNTLEIDSNTIKLDLESWNVKLITLKHGYVAHLATKTNNSVFKVINVALT